jgi:hypothetical protein
MGRAAQPGRWPARVFKRMSVLGRVRSGGREAADRVHDLFAEISQRRRLVGVHRQTEEEGGRPGSRDMTVVTRNARENSVSRR